LNLDRLQNKRTRFVVKALPTVLGTIGIFGGLVNQFGYSTTALIALIGALFLWIVASQVVETASPHPRPPSIDPLPNRTEGHTVNCGNCGRPVTFYPPDYYHMILRVAPCNQGDSIEGKLNCLYCGKENIRYWDNLHPNIGTVRIK